MFYAQIVNHGSKHIAFEKVMPNIYGCKTFSYDQILDTINYIGNDYEQFIEQINMHLERKWKRKTSKTLFNFINYYFEIDLPKEDRQFVPSKEERHLPIIDQALIYAASLEANDGYIFSKSIRSNSLPKSEKNWLLLDNDENVWHDVKDTSGKLLYRYMECVDIFEYNFINDDGQEIKFKVKEKRIVTFNPSFAKKQIAQIQKQIDKAKNISSYKQASKDDYGDSIKYVKFTTINSNGKIVKGIPSLNIDKINEDIKYAGYNLLVTFEINKSAEEIYNAYHGLWRIEESFKVMKTYLEAPPVTFKIKNLFMDISLFVIIP